MSLSNRRWENRLRHAADSYEVESLQADVMRFVAIIGFCLMAIFALVQSLPMLAPHSAMISPQQSAEAKRRASEAALADVQARHNHLKQEIAGMEDVLQKLREELSQLTHSKREETARQSTDTTDGKKPSDTAPESLPDHASPELATSDPNSDQTEALSLVFESDAAFTALLQRGAVHLLLIDGVSDEKYRLNAASSRFEPANAPRKFWRMDGRTVPDHYVVKARSLGHSDSVHWAVEFSESIQRSLKQHTTTRKNGDLIIHADGTVSHHE